MRDGVRLAAYVFLPEDGDTPLPVIWTHHRYHRPQPHADKWALWKQRFPWLPVERLIAAADEPWTVTLDCPWLEGTLASGYAIARVDVRGAGASFGCRDGPFSPEEARDARDVTEWLRRQPWCDGAVGMFGRSYMGTNQLLAAAARPDALRAVFPEMAMFDLFDFLRPGGVFRSDFARKWSDDVRWRDEVDQLVPLDDDADGSLLAAARAQHRHNSDPYEMFAGLTTRDAVDPDGASLYLERSPHAALDDVRRSRIPVYLLAGWYDPWVRDAILWFRNLTQPRRLVIGPWAHQGSAGIDLAVEHTRWYDRWLRPHPDAPDAPGDEDPGRDGGDAPVRYYTLGATEDRAWRSASTWPPPGVEPVSLYPCAGRSGTCRSRNDGWLLAAPGADGIDAVGVDLAASSGTATRWTNGYSGPFGYTDLADNDARGLSYTTPRLARDVQVTGHPIATLWVSTDAADCDVFVYLEEIEEDDYAAYVTEGVLRCSYRALGPAPYDNLGLPYHPGRARDLRPMSDGPAQLVLDLHPVSRVFRAGRRIRVTLTGADRDNAEPLAIDPPPTLRLHRDAERRSCITLPILGPGPAFADAP